MPFVRVPFFSRLHLERLVRTAPVRIGHLSDVDIFITDEVTSPAIIDVCRASNVEVIEVGRAPDSED